MTPFKPMPLSFPTVHHQRLHEHLLRHGLINQQQARTHSSAAPSAGATYSSLRLALEELGGLYSLFGLYLSTRIDLLSPASCDELSRIADVAEPSPFVEVQEFVEEELGAGIDQAFLAVEPMPYETTLLRDSYLAMLHNGENASLHVLRHEFRSFPTEEVDALRTLGDAQLFANWPVQTTSELFNDFGRELRLRVDFLQDVASLEALAFDAHKGDGLWAPAIIREYCRSGVLTLKHRPSLKLSAIISGKEHSGSPAIFSAVRQMSTDKLARLVWLAWLRQVFHGRVFPVQFGINHVSYSDDGQITFLGCVFSSTLAECKDKEGVWKYLLAVAADDPDECYRRLLGLMYRGKKTTDSEGLLASFRQAVTCFMAVPGECDFCSGLAARILGHLQLSTQAGYHPIPALIAFYRGLLCALATVRSLQPAGDSLLEAVEDVWVMGLFGSTRQMVRMDALGDIGTKYLAAMLELPTRLDAMLSKTVRMNSTDCSNRTTYPLENRDSSHSIALVLLLTAVLLLVRNGPVHLSPVWIERASFVVCGFVGLLMLRIATRS